MRANCWKATGGRPCEPCGGLQRRPAGDYAAPRGNCMGGEGITLPIHRQGDFLCAVLTVRAMAAGRRRRRGNCVKILLPETEPQGLERSGEQTAPENRKQRVRGESSANHAGRRASNPEISGPRFAPGNRKQRACEESSANHASRRALFAYRKPPPHTGPEGPSHFRRTPTKKRRAAARRFPLSY